MAAEIAYSSQDALEASAVLNDQVFDLSLKQASLISSQRSSYGSLSSGNTSDSATASEGPKLKIAIEGCGHGSLDNIYKAVELSCNVKGWDIDDLDFLIICGDFQAVRNETDLDCMSVPRRYRELGDFHAYYSGRKKAPVLTFVIGGNHEASNYFFELYHGGWLAENIYYLGAANVVRYGPFRIAGLSGIWKGFDFHRPHYERLPYNLDDVKSVYHVREYDVRKLLHIKTQIDIGLSHDWPRGVEKLGDYNRLFAVKRGFREDSLSGRLGSVAAEMVLNRLRPPHWFSGHLHVKYAAMVRFSKPAQSVPAKADSSNAAHVRNVDEFAVSVSDSDKSPSPPKPTPTHTAVNTSSQKSAPPVTKLPLSQQQKVNAWNMFAANIQAEEKAESERQRAQVQEQIQHRKTTGDYGPGLTFAETYRKVGEQSNSVVQTAKRMVAKPEVTPSNGKEVSNGDEIAVDLDVSSGAEDDQSSKRKGTAVHQDGNDALPADNDSVGLSKSGLESDSTISANLIAQLPKSFAKNASPPPAETIPVDITNTLTKFLALDKIGPDRNFAQLMEIHRTSGTEGEKMFYEKGEDGKYKLFYDPEWLAIQRTFASSLHVGDPSVPAPEKFAGEHYAARIEEDSQWITKNLLLTRRLEIPRNFRTIAPTHNSKAWASDTVQPREYPNPQTAEYCSLLDISNRLAISEEEIQSRMAAGPRPVRGNREGRGHNSAGGVGDFRSAQSGFRGGSRGRGSSTGGAQAGFRGGYGGDSRRGSAGGSRGPSRGGPRGGFRGGRGSTGRGDFRGGYGRGY